MNVVADMPPGLAAFAHPHLAEVVSVDDPAGLSRVQVRLYGADADTEAPHWARVATAFAGADRGAFFIPDVGDEVLVVFLGGRPEAPVVVGSLWNGAAEPPEEQSRGSPDRWTLTGKNGTRIAIVEEGPGREEIELETPNGQRLRLTDGGGGKVTLRAGGGTVQIKPDGISIETASVVSVDAAMLTVSAGVVSVDCGMATFTGVIQCPTIIAGTVIGTTYTPGAGNIW